MKIVIFLFALVLTVRGESDASIGDALDHCPSHEDLFEDTERVTDAELPEVLRGIRNGVRYVSNTPLDATIDLLDANNNAPLVQSVKLVSNALVKLHIQRPDGGFEELTGLITGANKYRIRGKPKLARALRVEQLADAARDEYTAENLEIHGCEQQVIDSVDEMAAENADTHDGEIGWDEDW